MSMDARRPAAENASVSTSGDATPPSSPPAFPESGKISLKTIAALLVGNSKAILTIADSPSATWLGLMLVFLAGFFREYDQADLFHQPWRLLLPVIASITLVALLFGFAHLTLASRSSLIPFPRQFRRLLTCFWMAAPMAIIYAIPVERFESAADAMRWNLTFLAIVSAWRVLLISRVISVLYSVSFLPAYFAVMFVADTLALIAMVAIPIPLLQVMGGIRLSEQAEIINHARAIVIQLGVLSWLIWPIALAFTSRRNDFASDSLPAPSPVRVSYGPWIVAITGFAVMTGLCTLTQPEQRRASRFESMLHRNRIREAVALASQWTPAMLPPHWDPPPRIDYQESSPHLFPILQTLLNNSESPEWLLEIYGRKLMQRRGYEVGHHDFWYGLSPDDLATVVLFLEKNPEARAEFDEGSWGSINCAVEGLLEKGMCLPASSDRVSPELALRLLNVAIPHEHGRCGTLEELRARLTALIPAAGPSGFAD